MEDNNASPTGGASSSKMDVETTKSNNDDDEKIVAPSSSSSSSSSWTSPILFDISQENDGSYEIDLNNYIGPDSSMKFNLKFPWRYNKDGKELREDLQAAAMQAGFQLVVISSSVRHNQKGKARRIQFTCSRHNLQKSAAKNKHIATTGDMELSVLSSNNTTTAVHRKDRKPSKYQPVSNRPQSKDCQCPFRFSVNWKNQENRWVLTHSRGSSVHMHHERRDSADVPIARGTNKVVGDNNKASKTTGSVGLRTDSTKASSQSSNFAAANDAYETFRKTPKDSSSSSSSSSSQQDSASKIDEFLLDSSKFLATLVKGNPLLCLRLRKGMDDLKQSLLSASLAMDSNGGSSSEEEGEGYC
jgi:hypothetical protein